MAPIVQPISWEAGQSRCLAIRRAVFINEQGIDENIEIDGLDPRCWHVIASLNGQDIGTARMKANGHIGRVAVLAQARGYGTGRALMDKLSEIAREHALEHVHLASQDSAVGFYEKLGFVAQGKPFIEANIPHLNMVLEL